MVIDDPLFEFADEGDESPQEWAAPDRHPWRILIADDDDSVHHVSKLVLRDFTFEGRPLEFLSAHSGAETCRVMEQNSDVALLLLDVVMETESAGLDVVKYVRDVINNRFTRIVLRTGQPGQAPEKQVVIDYDINDYKEKTELTAQKLITTVVSALRSYRDIRTIEHSRNGLQRIVTASRDLFEPRSLAVFSDGVLQQLGAFLHMGDDTLYAQASGLAAQRPHSRDEFYVLAGRGQFESAQGGVLAEKLPAGLVERLMRSVELQKSEITDHDYVGYFKTTNGSENLVYFKLSQPLSPIDRELIDVFSSNIGIAFDNVHLNAELTDTQSEVVYTLSELVESRSHETGLHVFRVGEISRHLGRLAGLTERECEMLRLAAPMHDLGKVGIPDNILNKPGKLTPEEMVVMRTHTMIGHSVLQRAQQAALQAAAVIAAEHHEWWDGGGYPFGKKGEEIHPFGRIVAIADVFDALSHERCYKPAWALDEVFKYFENRLGSQFDPYVGEQLLKHRSIFSDIWHQYPDQP